MASKATRRRGSALAKLPPSNEDATTDIGASSTREGTAFHGFEEWIPIAVVLGQAEEASLASNFGPLSLLRPEGAKGVLIHTIPTERRSQPLQQESRGGIAPFER